MREEESVEEAVKMITIKKGTQEITYLFHFFNIFLLVKGFQSFFIVLFGFIVKANHGDEHIWILFEK